MDMNLIDKLNKVEQVMKDKKDCKEFIIFASKKLQEIKEIINMNELEQFEQWLEKYPKLEAVYDFFKYTIYRRIFENNYYNIKWFIQKLFTDYNDLDRWNAYNAIAKYSLPLIKWTRENKSGIPSRLTEKQWNRILDSMIYSLEQCIDDTDDPCYNNELKGDELRKAIRKYDKKVHKGLKLFGNYFRTLWD